MKTFSSHAVRLLLLVIVSAATLAIGADPAPAQYLLDRAAPALDRNIASQTAPKSGPRSRYRTLLRKLDAPDDRATFGDFYDYGYWAGTSYLGQNDLPPGYCVYLAPSWYIFKEDAASSAAPSAPRQWGPGQATGAPDTWPRSGDIGTAWASKTPDGQDEWLQLCYAHSSDGGSCLRDVQSGCVGKDHRGR